MFTEEDAEMINGSLEIFYKMYDKLRGMSLKIATTDIDSLGERIRKRTFGKETKDTTFLDIFIEDALALGKRIDATGHHSLFKDVYGKDGVLILEEQGKIESSRIEHDTPVIISDPLDGSTNLANLIDECSDCKTMGEIFDKAVNELGEERAKREACTSSITLIKDNMIKYSLILNLFNGDAILAYPKGVFVNNINKRPVLEDFVDKVEFREDYNDEKRYHLLCYTGREEYKNNLRGTLLRFFILDDEIKFKSGPMRFAYLTQTEDKNIPKVGLIAHNGEKIQEFLPNIAVALFSKGNLQAYKLFCDPKYTEQRSGKQLTPTIANSLFSDGLIPNMGIKSTFLNNYDYPSEFRDSTIIISSENEAARRVMFSMAVQKDAVRIV